MISAFGVIHKASARPFRVLEGGLSDANKASGGRLTPVPNTEPFSANPKKFFQQQSSSLIERNAKNMHPRGYFPEYPKTPMRSRTKSGKTFPGRWVRL